MDCLLPPLALPSSPPAGPIARPTSRVSSIFFRSERERVDKPVYAKMRESHLYGTRDAKRRKLSSSLFLWVQGHMLTARLSTPTNPTPRNSSPADSLPDASPPSMRPLSLGLSRSTLLSGARPLLADIMRVCIAIVTSALFCGVEGAGVGEGIGAAAAFFVYGCGDHCETVRAVGKTVVFSDRVRRVKED